MRRRWAPLATLLLATLLPHCSALAAKRSGGKRTAVKAPTKAAKGFGAAKPVKALKRTEEDDEMDAALKALGLGTDNGICRFLNPVHLEPDARAQTSERLRAGEVVILRDAFVPEVPPPRASVGAP